MDLVIQVDGFGTHPATTSYSIFNMKISIIVGIPLLLGRFGHNAYVFVKQNMLVKMAVLKTFTKSAGVRIRM